MKFTKIRLLGGSLLFLPESWFNGNDEVAVFFKVTNVGGTHVFTEP